MSDVAAKIRDYRFKAYEIRKIADGIHDAACRATLLQMAEYYERLADTIEARHEGTSPHRH